MLAVILHIGVLFALKYAGFAATNVNTLLAHLHIPVQLAILKYVMPIGISFFALQALSYIVDVQRGVTKADTNLLRLTLFISFFPRRSWKGRSAATTRPRSSSGTQSQSPTRT